MHFRCIYMQISETQNAATPVASGMPKSSREAWTLKKNFSPSWWSGGFFSFEIFTSCKERMWINHNWGAIGNWIGAAAAFMTWHFKLPIEINNTYPIARTHVCTIHIPPTLVLQPGLMWLERSTYPPAAMYYHSHEHGKMLLQHLLSIAPSRGNCKIHIEQASCKYLPWTIGSFRPKHFIYFRKQSWAVFQNFGSQE